MESSSNIFPVLKKGGYNRDRYYHALSKKVTFEPGSFNEKKAAEEKLAEKNPIMKIKHGASLNNSIVNVGVHGLVIKGFSAGWSNGKQVAKANQIDKNDQESLDNLVSTFEIIDIDDIIMSEQD